MQRNTDFFEVIGSLRNNDGDAEDNFNSKMNLYFTYESCFTLKSFILFISVKGITKLNLGHIDKFEIKIKKISRRGSRQSRQIGHFPFLFCRGLQRNVQRFITQVH